MQEFTAIIADGAPPEGLLADVKVRIVVMTDKVTRHSKYVTIQLAEVAVTRNLFATILDRITRFALPPPVISGCPAQEPQSARMLNAWRRARALRAPKVY